MEYGGFIEITDEMDLWPVAMDVDGDGNLRIVQLDDCREKDDR